MFLRKISSEVFNAQAFVTHGNRWHKSNKCSENNFFVLLFLVLMFTVEKTQWISDMWDKRWGSAGKWRMFRDFFCCSSEMWIFRQWMKWCWWENGCYLRQEGMWWKAEGTMGDAVDIVEWNLLNLLTVKHDKVIFEEEEGVLCDEHQTLFLIVPMINPTK